METLGEAELVERTLKGDRDAFTKLYSAHQSRIYSALLYRTRSREDAEDLAADHVHARLSGPVGIPR